MSRRSIVARLRPTAAAVLCGALVTLTAACGSDPIAVPAAPVTSTVTTTVSAAPVTTTVSTTVTAVSTVTEQVVSTVVEQVVSTVTEQVAIQPVAAAVPAAPAPAAPVAAAVVAEPEPAASAYYANCSEARAAGAAPLHRGDAGYRAAMDRDDDGIACE